MFWTITIVVVVALVAAVGWFGRAKGTAKGRSSGDLSHDARRARWKAQGKIGNY